MEKRYRNKIIIITIGGPNAAQSGYQGEGRDQEHDQAEDGNTT